MTELSREVGRVETGAAGRKIETQRLENGAESKWHCGAEQKQLNGPGEEEKTQLLLNFPQNVLLLHTPPPSHTYTRAPSSPTQS